MGLISYIASQLSGSTHSRLRGLTAAAETGMFRAIVPQPAAGTAVVGRPSLPLVGQELGHFRSWPLDLQHAIVDRATLSRTAVLDREKEKALKESVAQHRMKALKDQRAKEDTAQAKKVADSKFWHERAIESICKTKEELQTKFDAETTEGGRDASRKKDVLDSQLKMFYHGIGDEAFAHIKPSKLGPEDLLAEMKKCFPATVQIPATPPVTVVAAQQLITTAVPGGAHPTALTLQAERDEVMEDASRSATASANTRLQNYARERGLSLDTALAKTPQCQSLHSNT